MFMRVSVKGLQRSSVLSSQFVKSISKTSSFSNLKNLKCERHVSLRTYSTALSETNESSELEQKDCTDELPKDSLYYWNYISTESQFSDLFFRKELLSENPDSSSLLFKTLREFSSKPEVVTEDLECLLPHLKTELQNLSFYELLEATNLTFKHHRMKDKLIWIPIQICFDKEFLRRRKSLSINETIMIYNVLASNNILKLFDFVYKTILRLAYKVDKLTHPQFVLFCFYFKRFHGLKLEKFKFEFLNFINNRIPSLNQAELGLLSDALIGTQLKFSPALFETVMKKVIQEMENMDAVPIKSICKTTAKIIKVDNLQLLIDFQEKLIPMLPKFKNHQLEGLVYSGFSFRYLNMALYDEVLKRVKSNMSKFTLFCISRFVFLNTNFNVDDKEFLDMALNEFRRRDSCLKQYVSYIKFLADLIHFQIYPKDLLEKVLSREVFTRVMTYKIGMALWASLKWNLEIEKPEIVTHELDEKLYAKLLKHMKYVEYPNQPEFRHQKKLNWMLSDIYGKDSVCSKRISFLHPNYSILRFDKNLKAQEIPTEMRNDVRKPPCDDHIWVSIFPLYRDCYTNYDEKTINYKTETYVRQLSILGYKQIFITPTEWFPCMVKDPSAHTVLESLIQKKLQEVTGEIQQTESQK